MNLLNEMVEQQMGMAEWNAVLDETGYSGSYTAAGLYDDAELLTIVGTLSERSGIPISDLVFAFGQFMFPAFSERYPELIDKDMGFLNFLATIDEVIHVEVKKLYPDASTPDFEHQRITENSLLLRYHSERQLCRLAEGLISGAAEFFDETYELTHEPCMHQGADHCGLLVKTR